MKKKVLISLTAMLAIVGLAFAATDGFNAEEWWTTYGGTLITSASTVKKETITAQQYSDIKAAVEAYGELDDDDITAVTSVGTCSYDADGLAAQVFYLNSKNTTAATSAVNALKDQINGMTASEKKASDRNDLEELQNKLAEQDKTNPSNKQWGAVKADFTEFAAAYNDLVVKVEDALLYVTADEWVVKVNAYEFDKTKYAAQKSVVEGYQTEGEALAKQTDDVKAALAKIAGWLDQYAAQEEEDKQASDREAFYTALDELSGLNFEYTLTQEDVDGNAVSSHYLTLTNLKNAWYYLSNDNSDDRNTWKAATAGIRDSEIAVAKDMLVEWQAMTDAITYLKNANHLYYDSTPGEMAVTGYAFANNDYAKIMQVKADLADDASTAGKKYIKDLFTPAKIKTLYDAAVEAFKTYDEAQFVKEAVDQFKADFSTILTEDNPETTEVDEAYTATADDYEATAGKKTTVRDAINEYKNFATNWNAATHYRNLTYGGNVVAEEIAWPIEATTKTDVIGYGVSEDLKSSVYPTLQILIKDAAEKKIVNTLLAELNTIYNENVVDSDPANYDEEAVKALKDAKTLKTNANNSAAKIGTANVTANAEKKVYATKNIQFWMWNAENNVIVECADLGEADDYQHNGKTPTAAKECWGYDLVINKFRKTNEYLQTQKPILQAMVTASTFLTNYATVIWPEGEITSELSTIASTAKTTYDGYKKNASSANVTTAAQNSAIVAYLAPIHDVTYANIAEATDDVDEITGTITLYQGTATKKVLESDPNENAEEALCYTSKKALAAMMAKVPNTIAYIEEIIAGDLPLNVVCLKSEAKDTKGNYNDWRATEIKLTYQKSFWFPIAINTVETISMDRTFGKTGQKNPFLVPFKVNVDDMDEHLTFTYLDMVEEIEQGEKVLVNLNYKTKKSGETLGAYLPYMITNDKPGTYTIYAQNTSVGVTKNTLNTKGQFVHLTSGGHKVDCSTTKTSYTMAGVTLAGAKFPASTETKKYYTLKNGSWTKFDVESTLPNSGTITLEFTTGRNKEYIVRHRDIVDDEATSIDNISTEMNETEGIYTINGQKVENTNKPGLYIVNGKKVIKR